MRRRWVGLSAGLTLCACGAFAVNGLADPGGAPVARGFVENRGQWPAVVQFSGAGAGATVYFTEAGLVLDFVAAQAGGPALAGVHPTGHDRQRAALEPLQRFALRMSFADGKPAGVSGRCESKARYNYLLGRDAAQWTRGAGAAGEVIYHEVWPGIDIVFHEAGGALAYNIVARPGAQAARVKFVYEGASWTESGASGDRIGFPFGVIADRRAADVSRV